MTADSSALYVDVVASVVCVVIGNALPASDLWE